MGGGTLKENRERTAYGEGRGNELEVQEAQARVMELITDKILKGTFKDGGSDLIKRAIELGVPYESLMQRIQSTLQGRFTTRTERQIGKGSSMRQRQIMMQDQARKQAGGY